MPAVPSIPARPRAPDAPVIVETKLTLEDGVEAILHAYRSLHRKQRRRILVMFLPIVWFLTLLGIVSTAMTEGGRKSFAAMLRDFDPVSLIPAGVFLGIVTAICVVLYLVQPWLTRRRVRTYLRAEAGYATPVPYRIEIDADGIAHALPGRSGLTPWSWIAALEENARYLLLVAGTGEDPVILPRRDLSPEQEGAVRAYARACIGRDPPPDEPDPFPDRKADALYLRYTLDADDRAALVLRTEERPVVRRNRIQGYLIAWVAMSLVLPLIFAFAWVADPYRVPLAYALSLYLEMFATLFWMPAVGSALFIVAVAFLNRRLLRWHTGTVGKALQAEARAGEAHVLIDTDGIVTAQAGARGRFDWSTALGVERVGEVVVLPLRRGGLLPLPMRAFTPEQYARFEALAAQGLVERGRPA